MWQAFTDSIKTAYGLARSCRIYYGDRARHRRMDALHASLISPGDLVFDVGAHVGDRVSSFRRLKARVVAVEPQPAPAWLLRTLYGRDPQVTLVAAAVAEVPGTLELRINPSNPTISTASEALVSAAARAPTWQGQAWTRTVAVPVTTLDELIARHGLPAFIKIDVEGFEAKALGGLSLLPRALSFEFTTIQRDVAVASLVRVMALGAAAFNATLGESQQFVWDRPVDAGTLRTWLEDLADDANSGDIYAFSKAFVQV